MFYIQAEEQKPDKFSDATSPEGSILTFHRKHPLVQKQFPPLETYFLSYASRLDKH
jgi:hypothetical protein